jgi:hypothetical protein
LFFNNVGEALDLRSSTKTFRNITIHKLEFGLFFNGVFLSVFLIIFVGAIVLLICRRKKYRGNTKDLSAKAASSLQGTSAGLSILYIASFVYMATCFLKLSGSQAQSLQAYHRVGILILLIKVLSPMLLLLIITEVFFCILIWVKKFWSKFDRISYSLVTIFAIMLILFMFRLNVIIL